MILPGPYAPTVTQWVAGTPTEDAYGNEVPAFTSRLVRVVADYPGDTSETDNRAVDQVAADRVILLPSSATVTARDEWTASDGLRYRVAGAPGLYVNPHTGTRLIRVPLRRIA